MIKKSSVLVCVAILAIGVSALAMNKSERGTQESTAVEGKITAIKGNVVTIKDSKGGELILEVKSTAGLKIGLRAWCEEDCGQTLKVGSTVVNVQKVLKKSQKAWGDPHVDGKKIKAVGDGGTMDPARSNAARSKKQHDQAEKVIDNLK